MSNLENRTGYTESPTPKINRIWINKNCKCGQDKKRSSNDLLRETHKMMRHLFRVLEETLENDLFEDVEKKMKEMNVKDADKAKAEPVKEKKPVKKEPDKHPALIIYSSIDKNEEDFAETHRSAHAKDSDETMVLLMFALAKEMAKTFGTGSLKEAHEYMTYLLPIPLRKVTDEVKRMVM